MPANCSRRVELVLLAALGLCILTATPAPAQQPNIVFIMADDLGWTDLGCYGSGYYQTPDIDALCASGMKFTNAYTCGPNCAPTRACLMTGQYTPRHGVYTVGSGARGQERFRQLVPVENNTVIGADYVTLAEQLHEAGYATCHVGKWHLGQAPHTGPSEQGFDFNVGGFRAGSPPGGYFAPYRNPFLADGPDGEYLTDRLTTEAVSFMEQHADEPFFLYLAHYAVHTPIQGKPNLVEQYRNRGPVGGHRNPTYAAMIHSLDESVGRVLASLDDLGLRENTLVIFYSDNGGLGGYARAGIEGANDVSDNAPLRGGKGMLYEGGTRVPLIASWPGCIDEGTVSHEPVITVDFYPTLCEIAGIDGDAPHELDGESLVSLLTSDGNIPLDRDSIYWHFPGYLQASGSRGTWRTTPVGAIRSGRWKLLEFFEEGHVELYDLDEDLGEEHDLSNEKPEWTALLTRRLHDWREEINAPMPTKKETE